MNDAAELQARIERAAAILQAAPDLNLADYSKGQVKKLVSAMGAAWAELTEGVYPTSARTPDERASVPYPDSYDTFNKKGDMIGQAGIVYGVYSFTASTQRQGGFVYGVYATQGGGGALVEEFNSLAEALAYVEAHKGEASFGIKLPNGKWHIWE